MLITPTTPLVSRTTVARPIKSPNPQVRFGQDNPAPQQPPAKSDSTSKVAHWLLTGLLGVGVVGNFVNSHRIHNQIDNMNQQSAAATSNTAQHTGVDKGTLDELARQVNILNQQVNELGQRTTLDQLLKVVETVTPSTVRVEGAYGLGSGVIIQDAKGRLFILTNGHVTEDNEINKGKDGVYHIKLYNGSDVDKPVEFDAAPVLLSDGSRAESSPYNHDLALLQIPPDIVLPANVRPVEMRDLTQDPVKVGEVVVAVGNPYGNRDSVSSGIISHVDRTFSLEPDNRFFQTDTPINPGNSGGGLFDMKGRLIGINTLGYRGADGLGGSIRIDVVKSVLESWKIPVLSSGEHKVDLSKLPASQPARPNQPAGQAPAEKGKISPGEGPTQPEKGEKS